MKKELTTNDNKLLIVGVPKNCEWDIDKALYTSLYNLAEGKSNCVLFDTEVDCKIINTLSAMTEEDCKYIVNRVAGYGYRNYEKEDYNGGNSPFDVWAAYHINSAIESFITLLRANGILCKWITEEPKLITQQIYHTATRTESPLEWDEMEKYSALPDELLIIEIK